MNKINPDSFKGKVLILIIDKLVIGAVLALAFFIYDQYKDERARVERIESQNIQLDFERAKMAKEFWPIIMDSKNDIVVRGYTLRSAIMSKAIEPNTGLEVAYKLYREGLNGDDFTIICKAALPEGTPALLKCAKNLTQEYLSIQNPDGTLNQPDSVVNLADYLNRIDKFKKSFRLILEESIQEKGIESFKILDEQNFLADNIAALYFIFKSERVEDHMKLANNKLNGLRLVSSLNRMFFDPNDLDAIRFIESEFNKDYHQISNIKYAFSIIEVINKYRINKIHGDISSSIAKIAIDTSFSLTKTTVENQIAKSYHYGLKWDAANFLLSTMQLDVRYNKESVLNVQEIIINYLMNFKDELQKAKSEEELNELDSKYEGGKIIRVLFEVIDSSKTDKSIELTKSFETVSAEKLRYFPFLLPKTNEPFK